ncbi:MAG: 4-hydroxythreonine-4-phosphate dehydrogenase PdxA [Paludibacteraceae bacterium]|nr:4-hydroxythreonine-4-phosphate dehydrogenase PdxA [Paludibacteraceae bacterium]
MKPIIAITAGDINGVSYEIILKTIFHPHILEICTPVLYGNVAIAKHYAQMLDEEFQTPQGVIITDARKVVEGKVNVITCYPDDTPLEPGKSSEAAGKASLASLKRACADLQQGLVHALVTAPINKENIQSDEFRYSGHTEYLTHLFRPVVENGESLMMMVSDVLKVALVCNHVPLSKVAGMITQERILHKLTILNHTLKNDFTIRQPRIAVLALNPHAGDGGLIGTEEQEIIAPAVAEANKQGILAFGPYSADGFFGSGHFAHFDAILAMYHDQGLIPFKSMDMNGVNYTAGLNVVRTSPDHGVAYDLAGKNIASPLSFRNALTMAIDILKQREMNKRINANPLPVPDPDENDYRPEFRSFSEPKSTGYRANSQVEN